MKKTPGVRSGRVPNTRLVSSEHITLGPHQHISVGHQPGKLPSVYLWRALIGASLYSHNEMNCLCLVIEISLQPRPLCGG